MCRKCVVTLRAILRDSDLLDDNDNSCRLSGQPTFLTKELATDPIDSSYLAFDFVWYKIVFFSVWRWINTSMKLHLCLMAWQSQDSAATLSPRWSWYGVFDQSWGQDWLEIRLEMLSVCEVRWKDIWWSVSVYLHTLELWWSLYDLPEYTNNLHCFFWWRSV